MKLRFSLICTVMIIIVGHVSAADYSYKIAVLGTKSSEINDLEDRFLREKLMRLFIGGGITSVPVTKIDSLIFENGYNLQNLNEKQIADISSITNAQYILTGEFSRVGNKSFYTIILYHSSEAVFSKKMITADNYKSFNYDYDKLAVQIQNEVLSIINEK